jgi:hypothetical protein
MYSRKATVSASIGGVKLLKSQVLLRHGNSTCIGNCSCKLIAIIFKAIISPRARPSAVELIFKIIFSFNFEIEIMK